MADRADNRPPYIRIAGHYRDLIASGELGPGKLLPSIKSLAREWEVSNATAEKAVGQLRSEGLVRGIHGVGTEVIGQPVSLSSGTQRLERGHHTGSSWGAGERSDSHTAAVVAAPKEVASALGLHPGDKVIRRTRVYRDRHGIVAHSTSWIPGEFAQMLPELVRGERLQGGTSLDLIARETGRQVAIRMDETSARIATKEDLQLLGLESSTVAAILVLSAKFLDANQRPLEYGVDLGAPGRTRVETSETIL
ncbi:GntR family transcriptional regulator [Streptomyces carminius]|uniref:GntR family transcriptional regulator n=1 Tax=Streptomyces carminius TaxID=2665496 RepID=A0A2M8LYZ5_9ACTN|nr:GntR family transcriptional regulator [Streptomyces carminius]PJE97160.1 GntR family transcriptional regulator [Streptomyces carminius]